MVWEGSSVGVLLELGRCSIDQEPCVKNLSFVRRQGWGVTSKVGGRWKGFSPEGGKPMLGLGSKWQPKKRKRLSDGM